jgi:hypothetical protein
VRGNKLKLYELTMAHIRALILLQIHVLSLYKVSWSDPAQCPKIPGSLWTAISNCMRMEISSTSSTVVCLQSAAEETAACLSNMHVNYIYLLMLGSKAEEDVTKRVLAY